MKVLLLGAGASKAYDGCRDGVRMPLSRDFLETFEKLPISENRWVLSGKVLNYGRDFRGIPVTEFFRSKIDIEEFHSEVESKMIAAFEKCRQTGYNTPEAIELQGVYVQLVFLFAATINEIQRNGVSAAHVNLAKTLHAGDTVITFNWDTLMDRALQASMPWRTDFGYGIRPHQIFRDDWKSPRNLDETDAVHLLKLHGSTNWITSYLGIDQREFALAPMQVAAPDRLYVFEFALKPYAAHAGRYLPGYDEFSYGYYPPNLQDDPGKSAPEGHVFVKVRPKFPWIPEGTADDTGLVSMPLIIPPVKEKSYSLFGGLFTELWSKAENALVEADEIALIGYSFPRTDHRSLALFKSAFVRRKTIPRIVIVNPDPLRIRELVEREFGIPASNISTISERFSSAFDCDQLWVDAS